MNDQLTNNQVRFGAVKCDIYGSGDDFYMTRDQIGTALGYENPRRAIKDIHRNYKRGWTNIRGGRKSHTPWGNPEAIIYNRKGYHGDMPTQPAAKGRRVHGLVWEIMDSLISGQSVIVSAKPVSQSELILQMAQANVELEKRVDKIEESTREISEKIDKAVAVFAVPDKDHWKEDINAKSMQWLRHTA
jgi:hypothetical protein